MSGWAAVLDKLWWLVTGAIFNFVGMALFATGMVVAMSAWQEPFSRTFAVGMLLIGVGGLYILAQMTFDIHDWVSER